MDNLKEIKPEKLTDYDETDLDNTVVCNVDILDKPENSNLIENKESILENDTEIKNELIDPTDIKDELLNSDENFDVTALCRVTRKKNIRFGDELFTCDYCDFFTHSNANLKKHVKTHSKYKKFPCDVCDYRTNRKEHLKSHKLTHTGIKNFACDQCDYKTNRKEHLKQHKLVHSSVKKFSCDECDYKSNRKDHLKRHKLVHLKPIVSKYNTKIKQAIKEPIPKELVASTREVAQPSNEKQPFKFKEEEEIMDVIPSEVPGKSTPSIPYSDGYPLWPSHFPNPEISVFPTDPQRYIQYQEPWNLCGGQRGHTESYGPPMHYTNTQFMPGAHPI